MLSSFTAIQIGDTVAAATAGATLARLGARVVRFQNAERCDDRSDSLRARLLGILNEGSEVFPGGEPWYAVASSALRRADMVVADVSRSRFLESDVRLAEYRSLVARHGGRSWVTVSPWGIHGPSRFRRADELPILAAGGIAHYMRNRAGRPMKPAGFPASITAGQFAALAALHGLLLSEKRGSPVHLDLSMQDALVVAGVFMECTHLLFKCSGQAGAARYAAPRGLMRCADGYIQFVVVEEHQWLGCVAALGNPDWATGIVTIDQRRAQADAIQERFEAWAADKTRREAVELLQGHGVPCTSANSCMDLINQPDLDVRGDFFRRRSSAPGEVVPNLPVTVTPRPAGRHAATSKGRAPVYRVLDATHVLAAPLATAWLGAMGVEVLKVEDLERLDIYRRTGPFIDGQHGIEHSAQFAAANYSKRSIALSLASADGRRKFDELMASTDLVVSNWSPHRRAALGLGSISDLQPRPALITCSGFAPTTASKAFRAYGMNTQGAGGAVELSRDRFGEPRNLGTPWADPLASIWVATLALSRLLGRGDGGADLNVAMVEAVAFAFPEYFSLASTSGVDVRADESRLDHAAPHGIYSCAGSHQWLAISVESEQEWANLVAALGSPASLKRPAFQAREGRLRNQDELDAALDAELSKRALGETHSLLQRVGVACAPVEGADELVADEHLAARRLFQEIEHPVWGRRRTTGLPWRLDGEGPVPITAAPVLGEYPVSAIADGFGARLP